MTYKSITIAQNADVVVPDAQAYPVTEVSKRIFTNSDITEMIQQFTCDAPLYADWILTKEDLLKDLTFAKQNIGTDGIIQQYIDGLEEQFNLAPEQSLRTPFDLETCPSDEYISAYADTGNNEIAYYYFKKEDNTFSYSRNKNQSPMPKSAVEVGMTDASKWSYPQTPSISESDALKTAQVWLDKLGVDLTLRSSEPCAINENAIQLRGGWQFIFTRNIAGVQTDYNYNYTAYSTSALPSTGAPWDCELSTVL